MEINKIEKFNLEDFEVLENLKNGYTISTIDKKAYRYSFLSTL